MQWFKVDDFRVDEDRVKKGLHEENVYSCIVQEQVRTRSSGSRSIDSDLIETEASIGITIVYGFTPWLRKLGVAKKHRRIQSIGPNERLPDE